MESLVLAMAGDLAGLAVARVAMRGIVALSGGAIPRLAGLSLDPRILLLTAAVTFWVGGFDVLYACQDIEFDRANSLNSTIQLRRPRRLAFAT